MISYQEHMRKTLRLAWPVCMSNVGNIMVGVVDIAMVGGIDQSFAGYTATTAQAAVSLANGFYFLVLVFGMGAAYGVTPLAAAADAAGRTEEKKDLIINSLGVNTLVALVLLVVLVSISPFLNFLGQEEEVVLLAIPYLNVMTLSMLPLAVFSSLKQYAEGLSLTRMAMIITIGSNLANVLLNWMFIYGHGGVEPMGVMGACWASFWARFAAGLAMIIYIYYGKIFLPLRDGFSFARLSLAKMKTIFGIGAGSGLQWTFEVSAFSMAMVMIGWIGETEQAAHQIALQLAAITYLFASGISSAASVRVGNQLGSNNLIELKRVASSTLLLVLAFQMLFAFSFLLLKDVLPLPFTSDISVAKVVSSLLLIAAVFQLSDGIQVVGLGLLRGIKDVTIPTGITLFAYWVVGVPACYFFAFNLDWGPEGIWLGLTLALTMAAILLLLRFNYSYRKMIRS